jgi:prepilin-type N-terminal cleavage/methylation domain-containing protein
MKMNKYREMFGSREGVTLVELLVVMLIVVILAVSLTPLFRDYIVRAQYTAEAVPVVADMRTKVTLWQYDGGFLPGVLRDAFGTPVASPGNSELEASVLPLQTFFAEEILDGGGAVVRRVYREGAVLTGTPTLNGIPAGSVADLRALAVDEFHFSPGLNVDYEHYTGNRLRPNHVFYRTDWAGFQSGAYMFVIGVFGDGNGLAVGTGYAVMEIHNPEFEAKVVATWERWRAVSAEAGQIALLNSGEAPALPAGETTYRRQNVCFIGIVADLMGTDEDNFLAALSTLRANGWEF